jgi:hypothetical protein
MKNSKLVYLAGGTMFIVFILNLYVGLVDRNLFVPPNIVITPHYYFNWMITGLDVTASALLFFVPSKKRLLILSGVIWPISYIATIGLDIVTLLCLGGPASTCFPSVSSAASYLLFGNSPFLEATFWPYTFILIILLLTFTIFFTTTFLRLQRTRTESSSANKSETKTEATVLGNELHLGEKYATSKSKIITGRKYRFTAGLVSGFVIGAILIPIFSGPTAPNFVGVGGVILSAMTYIGLALIAFGYFYKKDRAKTFVGDFAMGLGVGLLLAWFIAAGVEAGSNIS